MRASVLLERFVTVVVPSDALVVAMRFGVWNVVAKRVVDVAFVVVALVATRFVVVRSASVSMMAVVK